MTSETLTLDTEVQAEMELTLDHFNGSHADTVLFMTRHRGGQPGATGAEAVAVDASGIDVTATVDGRPLSVRLRFTEAVSTVPALREQVIGLIVGARREVGDGEPLTSLERELQLASTLTTFLTTVVEVDDLSPNLRRLIVRGGLEDYDPVGGDEFAYVLVPRDRAAGPFPDDFTMATYQEASDEERPYGAYYTIRRFDPDGPSLEIWAVLHDHDDGVGAWARTVEPGAPLALWGPRRSFHPPDGPRHHLYVADESGLAAVATLLDQLGPLKWATVVVETVDEDHEVVFGERPNVEIRWLHRGEAAPGTSAGFLSTVRSLDLDPADTVAFGAGESRQISEVRKHLRQDVGLPATQVLMTGYWRR